MKQSPSAGFNQIFVPLMLGLIALFMLGCGPLEQPAYVNAVTEPAPTINTAFIEPTRFPTSTPLPTLTPVPLPTATEIIPTETILIFGDRFHPDWGYLDFGTFTEITTGNAFSGNTYLQVIPREVNNQFLIRLLNSNSKTYDRENIIRFSFYLRSPNADLNPEEFLLKTQGSNSNIYWVENDSSANENADLFFTNTQLTFYEVRAIPQGEWLYIEVEPADQVFDPVYDFFTGFILDTREIELFEYHLDQIEITLEKE